MSNYDYEQEICCENCGKYLFTEREKNGKWSIVGKVKNQFKQFPNEDLFLCEDCAKEHESEFVFEV